MGSLWASTWNLSAIRDVTLYDHELASDCEGDVRSSSKESSPQGGLTVITRSRIERRLADDGDSPGGDTDSPDKQQLRLTAILTALQKSGSVSVEGLSKDLEVSLVTIRRDLDGLERLGLLRRTHGGAVSIEPLFYEPFRNDRSFQAQVERFAEEKRRIGRAAASLIEDGEIRRIYLQARPYFTNQK